MKKFSSWILKEAIGAGASDSVNKIIRSYLQKKLGRQSLQDAWC